MISRQTVGRRLLYRAILSMQSDGWRGYAFAGGLTVMALGLRLALEPVLGHHALFAVFLPATLFTAVVAGLGPAISSVALSVLLALWTSPFDEGWGQAAVRIAVYTGLGLLNAWIGAELRTGGFEVVQAEEDIRLQQAQIRTILQSVADAGIVIDTEGHIISFNATAEQQFGYAETEVLGKNIKLLMPEPYASAHDGYLRRYAETGEKHLIGTDRPVRARRKDGSTFPARLSVGELPTRERTYYVGFLRDLTENTEARARVAQLQGELARLSRLNELGEMASTLAHELNQPLSAITNFVQGSLRILKDVDPAAAGRLKGALEEAAKQALRAGRIVHHLREAATHGGTEMKRESLRAIIEESASLALTGSGAAKVKVVYRYTAEADIVFVDRVQIQQVLINLMRNALDSMSGLDEGRLTISTHMVDAATIGIEIADTGPGVSEDIAERLFQPFVTSKAGGMGIGLSISKRIIEAHDGRIGLSRNSEGGATFRVTLPLAEVVA